MTTVYAVSAGSYSDYSVKVLFASEELATAHAQALRGDPDGWDRDARVEPFELMDDLPEKITTYSARAGIKANGDRHPLFLGTKRSDWPEWDAIREDTEYSYGGIWGKTSRCKQRIYTAPAWRGSICVEVRGTDREAVVKSLSDGLAEALRMHDEGRKP